jgi:hypothetical protein
MNINTVGELAPSLPCNQSFVLLTCELAGLLRSSYCGSQAREMCAATTTHVEAPRSRWLPSQHQPAKGIVAFVVDFLFHP